MTIVLLGMLVSVGLALAVLALVAIPRVREGEKILTPDGEVAVRDSHRRARALATDARGRVSGARSRATGAARDLRGRAGDVRAARIEARAGRAGEPAPGSVADEPPDEVSVLAADSAEETIDLRERRRFETARERLARSLEWGELEAGPRHRR